MTDPRNSDPGETSVDTNIVYGTLTDDVRFGKVGDGPLSLARAAALGVRRVTYATSMFRETMAAVERIANEVLAEVPSDR